MPRSRAIHRSLSTTLLTIAALMSAASCGDGSISPLPSQWIAADSTIRAAVNSAAIPGLGVSVYDASDRLVFSRMYGDFAPDRRVAVASASKMITGLVLFSLIDQGRLTLDSRIADVLGWGGEPRMVTLRHLLSFTSGFVSSDPCTFVATITLEACTDQIKTVAFASAIGAEFDYGSTHLQVAARMAEVVTGKPWNQVFRETIADPLGLPAGVEYFTLPRLAIGTTNPLAAGGLRASMQDYAKMLAVVYHNGTHGGVAIGNSSLFQQQRVDQYPAALIRFSPMTATGRAYRYGLTAWLECDTPASGCASISSPGAFGFTPWLDRDAGYYAIIGMELAGLDGGVAAFSVDLQDALRPAIIAGLAGSGR